MIKDMPESVVDFSISLVFMILGATANNDVQQFGYFILAIIVLLFLRLKYTIKSEVLAKNDLCYKTLKSLVEDVKENKEDKEDKTDRPKVNYAQEQKGI